MKFVELYRESLGLLPSPISPGERSHPNAKQTQSCRLRDSPKLEGVEGVLKRSTEGDGLCRGIRDERADRELADSTRPWRVLLLNRAIVATRSHRPDLMESAFKAVVDGLPGDAPEFFREAMGQMAALNYPPQVRTVVQRYADAWCVRRTLH